MVYLDNMGSDNEYEHQGEWKRERGYEAILSDLRKDFGSARVDMLLMGMRVDDEDLRVIMDSLKFKEQDKHEKDSKNEKSGGE